MTAFCVFIGVSEQRKCKCLSYGGAALLVSGSLSCVSLNSLVLSINPWALQAWFAWWRVEEGREGKADFSLVSCRSPLQTQAHQESDLPQLFSGVLPKGSPLQVCPVSHVTSSSGKTVSTGFLSKHFSMCGGIALTLMVLRLGLTTWDAIWKGHLAGHFA